MTETEGAIRRRSIPTSLKGETRARIVAWAREQLGGIDPDLSQREIRQIRSGELSEITLRPRRPGFYDPATGEFIETFDTGIGFGGDIDEIEEEIDRLSRCREWVDEENQRFNQETVKDARRPTRSYWDHGHRMHDFVKQGLITAYGLWLLLEERGDSLVGYTRETHEYCYFLYELFREPDPSSHVFSIDWGRTMTIMRGSRKLARNSEHLSEVAHRLADLVADSELGELSDDHLRLLVGLRKPRETESLDPTTLELVLQFRETLTSRVPEESTRKRLVDKLLQS